MYLPANTIELPHRKFTARDPALPLRLSSSIRGAATTPDALASLFLSALPHPAFLADRPHFSLSVHRLASAGRRDLVTSILSSSLTSASSFLRLPPPASPTVTMGLLVRARLSSLDEDDDTASSVSSSASPSRSPSPPRSSGAPPSSGPRASRRSSPPPRTTRRARS